MDRIKSFSVDHNKLEPGVYISRIDGDITTWDLRFIKPNTPPFLENGALHTIEHLFATFARNSQYSENIIYFGPMGCRTGFYLLTRDLPDDDVLKLVKNTVAQIADHTGEIPGNKPVECGNYKEHDLNGAKKACAFYLSGIKNLGKGDINY